MINNAFQSSLDFLYSSEGGYSNNPNDRGGETFAGISRKANGDWKGWLKIDALKNGPGFPKTAEDDESLIESTVDFYRNRFWHQVSGEELPPKLAMAVFDTAVHSSPGKATKLLQISLGVEVDGIIGPKTIKAAFEAGENAIVELLARRAKLLAEIMDNDPSQKVFVLGWYRRLFKLANIVLEDENT